MIVIADTSPLNYLLQLGLIDILPLLYGEITVPAAVLEELLHRGAPQAVKDFAEEPPLWLKEVRPAQLDETLPVALGEGERQAISLATELCADLLLIDERAGRREAEVRNIQVAGTLAILTRASATQNLQLPNLLKRLKDLGFRVSPEVEESILARFNQVGGA